MKKILETKKDYEKLQRSPRPGEKVRSDACKCAHQQSPLTHFKAPRSTSSLVGRIENSGLLWRVLGGGSGIKAKGLFCSDPVAVPFLPRPVPLPACRVGRLAAWPWLPPH